MSIKLAAPKPAHSGAPAIHLPPIYGASPEKPILLRIPATGARPMTFAASGLPCGLVLDGASGILSGAVSTEGEYELTLRTENAQGADRATLRLVIREGALSLTPLLGWTSWNAYRERIDAEVISRTAHDLVDSGLAEYGYSYINIDSDWQGETTDRGVILPCERFADMKGLVDEIHGLGLKCGIYSTPMKRAFGIGTTLPGCTGGENDERYATCFPIGKEHNEAVNVEQWAKWGFDYLKYDWFPNDVTNAEIMKQCLKAAKRDFVYCVTVRAEYADREWYRSNCQSYRICRDDSDDRFEIVRHICFERDRWLGQGRQGGWCDLDMLETGYWNDHPCKLSEDEQVVAFTARVIFPSPIQLSCDLSRLSEFDRRLYCNEEVLAVNQDVLGAQAYLYDEIREGDAWLKVYAKPLDSGEIAYGVFNIGETEMPYRLAPEQATKLRDLWAKEDLGCASVSLTLEPHSCRLIRG